MKSDSPVGKSVDRRLAAECVVASVSLLESAALLISSSAIGRRGRVIAANGEDKIEGQLDNTIFQGRARYITSVHLCTVHVVALTWRRGGGMGWKSLISLIRA